MKKEAISHSVWEDLANRNDNWDKLDGVPEKVDLLMESKADKVEVDSSLELKADKTYVDSKLSEKANKQQEAWITPTLLNGWKSMSGREVQYMKDEMGFVHFRGDLDPSTKTSSNVFSVPIGYRPSRNEYINIGDTNNFIGCSIYGVVTVSISGASWQSLNYFGYRAD